MPQHPHGAALRPGSPAAPLHRRDVVDYTLQRRAAIAGPRAGRISVYDACDAHPHLQLAARHYGEPLAGACPVCGAHKLVEVHFVYGEELGPSAGQARAARDLSRLADRVVNVEVYAVEVCQSCSWNHLVRSFVVGRGELAHAAN